MSDELQQQTQIVHIPITVTKDHSRTKKLTAVNKQKVIQYLLNDFNLSKAAAYVNVTRRAVENCLKRDSRFNESYLLAKQFHVDNCKEAMFVVASQPSREGYNDRKLVLAAYEPDRFGNKLQVQSNQILTINISMPELNRILQSNNAQKTQLPEPIPDADVIEILPD